MVSFKGRNFSSHSFSLLGISDYLVIELRFLNEGNHIAEVQVFKGQPMRRQVGRQRMSSTRGNMTLGRHLITFVSL